MKQQILLISVLIFLVGCGSKPANNTYTSDESEHTDSVKPIEILTELTGATLDDDEVVLNAIRDFLLGNKEAVRFTERARQSLYESTWPEVQCSVEGILDSPSSFKDLTVKRVGAGLYKYECTCPDHGDHFIDYCTISAYMARDGGVEIEEVRWDEPNETFATLLDKAAWYDTGYGFQLPNIMTPSIEIWVEEVPGSVYRWTYEDICLACWPMLGAWAVSDYPDVDSYLTEDVKVKNVTYHNSDGTINSGYTSDGRVWYMKKRLLEGGEVVHAKVLVLIYPKAMQSDVEKLIEVVKGW